MGVVVQYLWRLKAADLRVLVLFKIIIIVAIVIIIIEVPGTVKVIKTLTGIL